MQPRPWLASTSATTGKTVRPPAVARRASATGGKRHCRDKTLSIRRQCSLMGVTRSGVYRPKKPANNNELALMPCLRRVAHPLAITRLAPDDGDAAGRGKDFMIHNVTIAARDGAQLAASVFVPNGPPRCVVIINSATAVPRKIYRVFAGYLAERGLVAVTYDYRGIGELRRASFTGVDVRMRDWAELDVAGAIDHARTTWPALPISIVGHSFGGQALGLIDNNREISRALLVAAQAAY